MLNTNEQEESKNLTITEKDKQKFPDLFVSKKQMFFQDKVIAGTTVRNKLKSLKRTYLEDKINREKEQIRQRYEFEELIEKYRKYHKDDQPDLPIRLDKSKRLSMNCASQPQLLPSDLDGKTFSYMENPDTEIRLPNSQSKNEAIKVPAQVRKLHLKNGTKSMKVSNKDLISKFEKYGDNTVGLSELNSSPKSHRMVKLNLNSQSVGNLKIGMNNMKTATSRISTIDESDEFSIEDKMKNLPHWKYSASFVSYMDELKTITKDVKDDFMKLYHSKQYMKMYKYLCNHKPLKKYFDNFVLEANQDARSPDIIARKKEQSFSKNENLEVKPYYRERAKVQSRLFGELQSSNTIIDWKNLEKMSNKVIGQADMTYDKLLSLSKVLENELVRLTKQDALFAKQLSKVSY